MQKSIRKKKAKKKNKVHPNQNKKYLERLINFIFIIRYNNLQLSCPMSTKNIWEIVTHRILKFHRSIDSRSTKRVHEYIFNKKKSKGGFEREVVFLIHKIQYFLFKMEFGLYNPNASPKKSDIYWNSSLAE